MEGKGENGILEGASDCEDERAKLRPADIDADVREMERRKRVEAMMSSRLFREELERIVEAQMKDGAVAVGPLLQQIQDMMQTGSARGQNTFSVKSTNCVIPINDIRGVESMGYAKGEKILRCKLAAVYRLMDLYGWTQGINNHITGRLNQEEELLLVNAYGMLFHEITASSLVKVDMQGNIVEPGTTNYGCNIQAFQLHAAIHQARPDIKCIIHVHTPSVLAVSSLKVGLLPLSNESVVIGEVSNHQSTGSLQEPEEKDKLARNLGPINKVMLLSNNGAVCCGETVEEAFFNVYNTVLACESQMKVMPLGIDNLVLMQDEVRKAVYDAAHKVPDSNALPSTTGQPSENKEKRWRIGGLHFEALMRMLDNAGFRTGYIYRTPLVKGEPPKPKSDVEVPPAVSSLGYLLEEEEMYRNWKKMGATKNDRTRWLNSPNVYQKVEILETGTPDPKKITKWVDANAEEWVADGSPTHSSTPVKISDALQFVPKNTNPKEFKKLQQQIKENRRADKITSGPQSHILEGVSWEEAKRLQDANMTVASDQVVLVGAASKGIIQREYQHNATVYKTPYTKNPFDSVSAQEIEDYKRTVTRKQRGLSYDEDGSESEALSSSAALPPSGFKSPPSETDDDSRTEPRVLRIETKMAPISSQAEYVLSDDGKRKFKLEDRIRCFSRIVNSPTSQKRELPLVVDIDTIKKYNENSKLSSFKKYSLKDNISQSYDCEIPNLYSSSKWTQTVLSINEISNELCGLLNERGNINTTEIQEEKPLVVRKLVMNSVIDELRHKFRVNRYEKNYDSDKDHNSKCSESDATVAIYPLPNITNVSNFTGNDFTSDDTTTKTSNSSCYSPVISKNNQIASHNGDEFQFGESMIEQCSSNIAIQNFNSFVISDLFSDVHINNSDENLEVTPHKNETKKAVLVKNKIIIDRAHFSSPLINFDKSIDFAETSHSTSCEGSHNSNESVHEYSVGIDDTSVSVLNNSGIKSVHENICEERNLKDSTKTENNIEKSSFKCNLTIDGFDLYSFYENFDPNEVFQKDSDNLSMKALYDDQSIPECGEILMKNNFVDDIIRHNIIKNDSVVNENIYTGKRYLLNRYLMNSDNLEEGIETELNSLKENEMCCGTSEDSAIYSAMIKDKVSSDISDTYKFIDWSLSQNSLKELDSSDSSGIKLFGELSDRELPTRQRLNSIDEFLIKEEMCKNIPNIELNNNVSSRRSYHKIQNNFCLNVSQSTPNIFLNDSNTLRNYRDYMNLFQNKLPDLSTVQSYYTLVSLDRNFSLPDLRRLSSYNSDSSSSDESLNLENDGFDYRGDYISDDYVCFDSETDSESNNLLHFHNENNCDDCSQNFDLSSEISFDDENDELKSISFHEIINTFYIDHDKINNFIKFAQQNSINNSLTSLNSTKTLIDPCYSSGLSSNTSTLKGVSVSAEEDLIHNSSTTKTVQVNMGKDLFILDDKQTSYQNFHQTSCPVDYQILNESSYEADSNKVNEGIEQNSYLACNRNKISFQADYLTPFQIDTPKMNSSKSGCNISTDLDLKSPELIKFKELAICVPEDNIITTDSSNVDLDQSQILDNFSAYVDELEYLSCQSGETTCYSCDVKETITNSESLKNGFCDPNEQIINHLFEKPDSAALKHEESSSTTFKHNAVVKDLNDPISKGKELKADRVNCCKLESEILNLQLKEINDEKCAFKESNNLVNIKYESDILNICDSAKLTSNMDESEGVKSDVNKSRDKTSDITKSDEQELSQSEKITFDFNKSEELGLSRSEEFTSDDYKSEELRLTEPAKITSDVHLSEEIRLIMSGELGLTESEEFTAGDNKSKELGFVKAEGFTFDDQKSEEFNADVDKSEELGFVKAEEFTSKDNKSEELRPIRSEELGLIESEEFTSDDNKSEERRLIKSKELELIKSEDFTSAVNKSEEFTLNLNQFEELTSDVIDSEVFTTDVIKLEELLITKSKENTSAAYKSNELDKVRRFEKHFCHYKSEQCISNYESKEVIHNVNNSEQSSPKLYESEEVKNNLVHSDQSSPNIFELKEVLQNPEPSSPNVHESEEHKQIFSNSEQSSPNVYSLEEGTNYISQFNKSPIYNLNNTPVKPSCLSGCIKCFTMSMEESVSNVLSNDRKRNLIISALKQFFKNHKCTFNKPKCKKSNSKKRSYYFKFPVVCNENFGNFNYPKWCNFNNELFTTDNNSYTDSDDETLLNYDMSITENFKDFEPDMSDQIEMFVGDQTKKIFSLKKDVNMNISESSDDKIEHDSNLSECYKSLPSSLSEIEAYYSGTSCEFKSVTNTLDFYSVNESKINGSNLSLYSNLSKRSTTLTNSSCDELNTAFYLNSNEEDDMDNYLKEISINVSSVSCQTDESFSEDEYNTDLNNEYKPQDFSDDSNTTISNSSNFTVFYESNTNYSPSRTLYTIFENSNSLSPEY